MRTISYPETTNLKPPVKSVKTKGAPNKVTQTPCDNSIKWSPSYFKMSTYIFQTLQFHNPKDDLLKVFTSIYHYCIHHLYQK